MFIPSGRRGALPVALALVLAACSPTGSAAPSGPTGSGAACGAAPSVPDDLEGWSGTTAPPDLVPVMITNVTTCGGNRVLFSFFDGAQRPIAKPDRSASFRFFNLGRDSANPIATVDGTFVWAIEDAVGIYVTNVDFPESGRYGVEIETAVGSGASDKMRLTFDVRQSTAVIKVGDKAPASKTPTLADVGGDARKISTDADPDPAFYETSIDQAVAKHEPFVVIFATPKFCTSAQCGPTLDRIKPFVARYPTVTFINVEPYKLELVDGELEAELDANNRLQATDVSDKEWHLLNEPTVYVVNREGVVTANFELIFSDEELTAALDAVK